MLEKELSLAVDDKYYFRIRTIDVNDNMSAEVNLDVTSLIASSPVNFVVSATTSSAKTFSWEDPTTIRNGETITGWEFKYKLSSSSDWSSFNLNADQRSRTLDTLVAGQTYDFSVNAKTTNDGFGASA